MTPDDKYDLHEQYLNHQMVRVLRTLKFDVNFVKGDGPYLFDVKGDKYLDLLSGFGVFALGRNHPVIAEALISAIKDHLPNLVQLDVSHRAGLLARRLVHFMPSMGKVFFCSSGSEAVESAMKFARAAVKKEKILYCSHAFHGLTYGALSLNGDPIFKKGFEPLVGGTEEVPFNDLAALEEKLKNKDVAAFIIEPIQGKGVYLPDPSYLADAKALCARYGALFVVDEIQTGLCRAGKFLAIDHWNIEPDMVLMAKALSGGFIPVGAVAMKSWIFDRMFDRMDKALIHGSTFGKNELAMTAGLATLQVMEDEDIAAKAMRQGEVLLDDLKLRLSGNPFVKNIRGKGLMIGLEFGRPAGIGLGIAWDLLEKAGKGLFCQLIIIPLFRDHKILVQVAGNETPVIKLLPSLTIEDADRDWIVNGFAKTIADCNHITGPIWNVGRQLASSFVKEKRIYRPS